MKKADIRGKWALVTGASRGIGRQVCMGLSQYGCNLVLHSRDIAHTKSLAAELTAKGVQVRQVAGELSDQNQVDAMLTSVLSAGTGIDILYNNAAVMTPFRKSFEVNVTYNIALVSSSEETKNN